jgi:hypothetical protein
MVPPPHLAHRWQQFPRGLRRIVERLDTSLAERRPFTRMGDHFLIELVKR